MEECTRSIQENAQAIMELKIEKIESAMDALEDANSKIQNNIDLKETKGYTTTASANNYLKMAANENKKKIYLQEQNELLEYQNESLSKTSTQYIENAAKIRENNLAIQECTKSQAEWYKQIANLKLDSIDLYLDRLEKISSLTDAIRSYNIEKYGKANRSDYDKKIAEDNKNITENNRKKQLYDLYKNLRENGPITSISSKTKKQMEKILGKSIGTSEIYSYIQEINSRSKDEWKALSAEIEADIYNTKTEIEELKDELRDLLWSNKFDNRASQIESTASKLSGMIDILNGSDLVDDDRNLTEQGTKKIELLCKQMDNARKSAKLYNDELKELNKGYKNGQYTQEEYNEKLKEIQSGLLSATTDMQSYKDAIVELQKDQTSSMLDGIQKVIDKQKEALSGIKAYNDYMREMNNKSRTVNSYQAQLDALNATEDSIEKQAQIAQLQAQLRDAEEDLAETKESHRYETITNGLDDFYSSLEENFDTYIDSLETNFQTIDNCVADMAKLFENSFNGVNAKIGDLAYKGDTTINSNGTVTIPGFSTGGSVEDGIAGLKKGEYVLDKDLTKLMKTTLPLANTLSVNVDKALGVMPGVGNITSSGAGINFNSPLMVIENISGANTDEIESRMNRVCKEHEQRLYNQLLQLRRV